MLNRFAPVAHPCFALFGLARLFQERLYRLVAHKEESGTGGGANERGADTGINTAETAGLVKAGGGLEASLEGVDGVEGEVDCGTC